MLTFKQYLNEKVVIPSSSGVKLNLKRNEMPQVDKKNHVKFLSFLKDKDIGTKSETVDPNSLKPSQIQFNKKKIEGMIEGLENGSFKPKSIIVSKDNYVIDGHHTWLALLNTGKDVKINRIDVGAKNLFNLMHEFPDSYVKGVRESFEDMVSLEEAVCPIITKEMMDKFETFVDRMFKKFNIDFDFTRHFRERMSDERNNPCIDPRELASIIKKIYDRQAKSIKAVAGAEAVIKDLQSDLNIPIAVEYNRKKDEFRVAMKTIMRKKNFRTPSPIIKT